MMLKLKQSDSRMINTDHIESIYIDIHDALIVCMISGQTFKRSYCNYKSSDAAYCSDRGIAYNKMTYIVDIINQENTIAN